MSRMRIRVRRCFNYLKRGKKCLVERSVRLLLPKSIFNVLRLHRPYSESRIRVHPLSVMLLLPSHKSSYKTLSIYNRAQPIYQQPITEILFLFNIRHNYLIYISSFKHSLIIIIPLSFILFSFSISSNLSI